MRPVLLLIFAAAIGCTHRPSDGDVPLQDSNVISVGQPWEEATAVGRRMGYRLNDASQLAMQPTPDGFYVDLLDQSGLIVLRDRRTQTVKSLKWVENWIGPKGSRIYHVVQSFKVPPARPAGR